MESLEQETATVLFFIQGSERIEGSELTRAQYIAANIPVVYVTFYYKTSEGVISTATGHAFFRNRNIISGH